LNFKEFGPVKELLAWEGSHLRKQNWFQNLFGVGTYYSYFNSLWEIGLAMVNPGILMGPGLGRRTYNNLGINIRIGLLFGPIINYVGRYIPGNQGGGIFPV